MNQLSIKYGVIIQSLWTLHFLCKPKVSNKYLSIISSSPPPHPLSRQGGEARCQPTPTIVPVEVKDEDDGFVL